MRERSRRTPVGILLAALMTAGLLLHGIGPAAAFVIDVDHFTATNASVDLKRNPTCPGPPIVPITDLSGPATVNVIFDGPDGAAHDTNGNGRDDVPTEMVQLDLTSPSTGVVIRIRPASKSPFLKSTGNIDEDANTQSGRLDLPPFAPSGTATSIFNIFVEIQAPGLPLLHNQAPVVMRSVINNKPPMPGTIYIPPTDPDIPLYNEANQLTCYSIAHAEHVTGPVSSVECEIGPGLATFTASQGIASITHTQQNATVSVAPFAPGATTATATFAKVTPNQPARVNFTVTDVNGISVDCDPVPLSLSSPGQVIQRASGVSHTESRVEVVNGTPGFSVIALIVNSTPYVLANLVPGESRLVDVSSAMRPGNSNVITVVGGGRLGATAELLIF